MSRPRLPRSPLAVAPIGPTALQRELQATLRAANRVRRIGSRQSQRLRDVLRGQTHAARTLELVIAELIAGGAPDEDVLALVTCVEHDTRMKLSVRRGDAVPGYVEAHCAEFTAEGIANAAQARALAERSSPSALRAALSSLCRHAHAIKDALTATHAELRRVESHGARSWK